MPDTPWRVTHAVWLATETERVKDLILVPKFWHHKWTPHSLKVALNDLGLDYSLPQMEEINGELHRLGVVEDVAEPRPGE
jgi:hypothetical protein